MSNRKFYVGKDVASLKKSPELEPFTKIIVNVGEDEDGNTISGIYDSGLSGQTLEVTNELISPRDGETAQQAAQRIAEDMYHSINDSHANGYRYRPFEADDAFLSDDVDLGDSVNVGGIYGMITKQGIEFDSLCVSDISSPNSDETENEFGDYVPQSDRNLARKFSGLSTRFTVGLGKIEGIIESVDAGLSSRITQTVSQIEAEVRRANAVEGELSSRITMTADSITAEVSRASDAEGNLSSRIEMTAESITSTVERNMQIVTDELTSTTETLRSEIRQTASEIALGVKTVYETKANAATTRSQLESQISVAEGRIALEVSETYETKTEGLNTRDWAKSAIEQYANHLGLEVEGTYAPDWVSGRLYSVGDYVRVANELEYRPTTDTSPISGKVYYTKSGADYFLFTGIEFDSRTTYYEYNSSIVNTYYRCIKAHWSNDSNKPGEESSDQYFVTSDTVPQSGKTYYILGQQEYIVWVYNYFLDGTTYYEYGDPNWATLSYAPTVSSEITLGLDSLTLGYNGSDNENSAVITLSGSGITMKAREITMSNVTAEKLSANTISIYAGEDRYGHRYDVGTFSATQAGSIDPSVTDYTAKLNLNTGAYSMYSEAGDTYIEATRGYITLKSTWIPLSTGSRRKGMITIGGDLCPKLGDYDSGSYNLGASGYVWNDLYITNANANSSDRNIKKNIAYGLDRYDEFFDGLNPCSYEFKDGHGRTHFGMIAQDVEELISKCGLTTMDVAAFIKSENGDGATHSERPYCYALRYGEFIPLLIWEVQQLKKKVRELSND